MGYWRVGRVDSSGETMSLQSVVFFISMLCCLFPIRGAAGEQIELPIPVFVSIAPQATFVRAIGGERVQVEVLVRPGASPATYAPTPKQLARLARAKLFFRIGVPFESALVKRIHSSMPGLGIVDISGVVSKLAIGSHGHGEDEELDPHTWMDPMLVKKEAAIIASSLSGIDPAGKPFYEENYRAFAGKLDALDARIRRILKPVQGRTVLVYHPAYGYFCRAYGLHQKAIESGGKTPGAQHLARLITEAKREHIRAILVQPQFSRKKASLLARAIGAKVVVADPLAADYMENLEQLARQLAKVL
jgi:zinc transport system substrate-binding protein